MNQFGLAKGGAARNVYDTVFCLPVVVAITVVGRCAYRRREQRFELTSPKPSGDARSKAIRRPETVPFKFNKEVGRVYFLPFFSFFVSC